MTAEAKTAIAPQELAIREGLFVVAGGKPKLIGSRCRECGNTFFPAEIICPVDIKEDTLEQIELDGNGQLISYTQVKRGLPGFDSPYALAVIKLETGPGLIAQLEGWQEVELKRGMPMELVIGRIKRDPQGIIILGPKFRPLSRSEGGTAV
jgi:uncharacterized OB-fold protein